MRNIISFCGSLMGDIGLFLCDIGLFYVSLLGDTRVLLTCMESSLIVWVSFE